MVAPPIWTLAILVTLLGSAPATAFDRRDLDLVRSECAAGEGCDLGHADLSSARLRDVKLHFADLSRADLTDSRLTDAALIGANLRRANISDAILVRPNLTGADLTNANLDRLVLIRATLCNTVMARGNVADRDCPSAIEIAREGRTRASVFAMIRAVDSGKCLEIDAFDQAVQRPCNNGDGQLFGQRTLNVGLLQFFSKDNDQNCLGVERRRRRNGAAIERTPCQPRETAQQFQQRPVANGRFNIVNRRSGKCVEIRNGNHRDNVAFVQYDCDGSPGQTFEFVVPRPDRVSPGDARAVLLERLPGFYSRKPARNGRHVAIVSRRGDQLHWRDKGGREFDIGFDIANPHILATEGLRSRRGGRSIRVVWHEGWPVGLSFSGDMFVRE